MIPEKIQMIPEKIGQKEANHFARPDFFFF